jgi:hypothetical protein
VRGQPAENQADSGRNQEGVHGLLPRVAEHVVADEPLPADAKKLAQDIIDAQQKEITEMVRSFVDNEILPMVFRRWAKIHPFVTIIGAFAGIQYFGLLGLLIGPLAISYFFELIRMYRAEYLEDEDAAEEIAESAGVPSTGRPVAPTQSAPYP